MASHGDRITPPRHSAIITPNNDAPLAAPAVLYIGTAGTLHYLDGLGNEVASTPVAAGLFPFLVTKVFATGTGAENIIAGYVNT